MAKVSDNRFGVGSQIEDSPNAGDDCWQGRKLRETDCRGEPVGLCIGLDDDDSDLAVETDRSCVSLWRHHFDALNRAQAKETDQAIPIERRSVWQFETNMVFAGNSFLALPAQCGRGPIEQLLESLVEATNATEA